MSYLRKTNRRILTKLLQKPCKQQDFCGQHQDERKTNFSGRTYVRVSTKALIPAP